MILGTVSAISLCALGLYLIAGTHILARSPALMARGIPARLTAIFILPALALAMLPSAWRASRRAPQP